MGCLVCLADRVRAHLDVGRHPVSSFFLTAPDQPEVAHSLSLGQCEACGTIQLMTAVPHDQLVAPYDWLSAREPEEHLDAVVANILALPGLDDTATIVGLTSKDDTTLDRFRNKGFASTWRLDVRGDLDVASRAANIETVQHLTTPETMAAVAARRGAADVLIVRHIIEHAENIARFVRGLAALVRPGGYLMVELPDCTTSLERCDYAMIWEEHPLYFTPETFADVLALGGFETVRRDIYPLPFENCIVHLARKTGAPRLPVIDPRAMAQVGLLARYAAAFAPTSARLRRHLESERSRGGRIAVFGAGHIACAFVNFHGLAGLIAFVADDTPQKQGLFLPGARLPIRPSRHLLDDRISLCILALSISSEDKVIERNPAFLAAGGRFRSSLRASGRAIFSDFES